MGVKHEWKKEIIAEAIAHSTSISDVARYMEIPHGGGNNSTIKKYIEFFGLDTSHFYDPTKISWTKEDLEQAIKSSTSLSEIDTKLGLGEGNRSTILKYTKLWDIDVSHLKLHRTKLTNIEFREKIHERHGDNYTPLEAYKDSRTKVKFLCNICGEIWDSLSVIKGSGCPQCGEEKAKNTVKWHVTQEEFLNKIPPSLLSKIDVLTLYKSVKEPIQIKCKICNHEWTSKPLYLYKDYGCGICARKQKGIASRKTHEDYIRDVYSVHGDRIKVLGNYSTGETRIAVSCIKCNHIWEPRAGRVLHRGCPKCNGSKGEFKIKKLLDHNKIVYIQQYTFEDLKSFPGHKLKFDFAIFDINKLNHLVEYDGIQHYEPLNYTGGEKTFLNYKQRDILKNEYCKTRNIKLIRIPYWDYPHIDIGMVMGYV